MSELKRILLVEDDNALRAVLKLALQKVGGFVVKDCESGRRALEDAEPFAPDLVLLDVVMPDMDGPTTLTALRELSATREVPVVFLTAKTDDREVSELLRCGAQGVIAKPFDPMRISDQVQLTWNRCTTRRDSGQAQDQ